MKTPDFQTNKNINGWFWDYEGTIYQSMIHKIKNGNILEIGNYHGLSISYIVAICKKNNNHIHAIDCKITREFLKNISRWKAESTITPLKGNSHKCSSLFPNNFFNLIFIDGNHSFDSVRKDIIKWWPKLKLNGLLLGHDYDTYSPGVIKIVNLFFPSCEKIGRFWFLEKKSVLLNPIHYL